MLPCPPYVTGEEGAHSGERVAIFQRIGGHLNYIGEFTVADGKDEWGEDLYVYGPVEFDDHGFVHPRRYTDEGEK